MLYLLNNLFTPFKLVRHVIQCTLNKVRSHAISREVGDEKSHQQYIWHWLVKYLLYSWKYQIIKKDLLIIDSLWYLIVNFRFSPEALSVQFTNGLLCWLFQVLLLEATLQSLGGGDVAVLDIVAYGGYSFVAASVAVLARVVWRASFYGVALWECLCMGVFFVKTMKRILISEVTSSQKHSSKCHYLLLLVALAQAPLLFWLGSFGD